MKNRRYQFKKIIPTLRLGSQQGSKKIRKKRSKWSKFSDRSKHLIPWIIGGTSIIFLFILGFFLYKKRFTNEEFEIKDILIEEESIIIYDNQEILSTLKEGIIGKNYRTFMLGGKSALIQNMKEKYPIISGIDILPTEREYLLYTNIKFHTPVIQFKNNLSSWIVRENKGYKIQPSDAIQENTIIFYLPAYTDSYEELDGIFYKIHGKSLENIISKISDIIPLEEIEKIEYDPGGEKLHLRFQGKLILFHLDKSIDGQLVKLLDIKQYYKEYSNISKMDLGSSDHIIVK